jgi:hypothetical protein
LLSPVFVVIPAGDLLLPLSLPVFLDTTPTPGGPSFWLYERFSLEVQVLFLMKVQVFR